MRADVRRRSSVNRRASAVPYPRRYEVCSLSLAGVSSARETTMNKTPNVACLLLSLLVCAAALPGQTSLSTTRGTVKDPSGLVVPAVEVTVTDIGTSVQVRAADTD